jgi:hypothetical protein
LAGALKTVSSENRPRRPFTQIMSRYSIIGL